MDDLQARLSRLDAIDRMLKEAWYKGFRWGIVVAGLTLFLALLVAKLIGGQVT